MNNEILQHINVLDYDNEGWDENSDKASVLKDGRLSPVIHVDYVMDEMEFSLLEDWEKRRAELREQILVSAGLWPMPLKCALNARVYDRVVLDGFSVEKVTFESYPGFYVTGNLYRPLEKDAKFPAILNPHGHWKNGRLERSEATDIPTRCANFALMGFVSFSYDMIGFQDSKQINHLYGGQLQDLWCLGAFGIQLWNSIRSIDFLESLEDVDVDRIGCTGASGGGTQTFFLSAIDERIKTSVPVNMISKHMQGGCNCEIAPLLHIKTDNLELAALTAPRSMYLISTSGDWTKNTPHIEYPEILSIYDLYGKGDELEYFYQDAEHNYNKKSREAAYNWFARKLQGRDIKWQEKEICFGDVERFKILPLPNNEKLSVVSSNADLFEFQKSERVQALERLWDEDFEYASNVTCTALHHIIGVPKFPIDEISSVYTENVEVDGMIIRKEIIGTKRNGEQIPVVCICKADNSGSGTISSSGLASSSGVTSSSGKVVLVIHPEGKKALFEDSEWNPILMNMIDSGYTVVVTDLFLTGEFHRPGCKTGRDSSKCNHFTTFNYTDAALQVQDIVTVYNYLSRKYTQEIVLVGVKEAATLCLTAIPFIKQIKNAVLDFSTFSYDDEKDYLNRFYIPGFLSAGGFKTCVRLSSLEKLTLFNVKDVMTINFIKRVYETKKEKSILDITDHSLDLQSCFC